SFSLGFIFCFDCFVLSIFCCLSVIFVCASSSIFSLQSTHVLLRLIQLSCFEFHQRLIPLLLEHSAVLFRLFPQLFYIILLFVFQSAPIFAEAHSVVFRFPASIDVLLHIPFQIVVSNLPTKQSCSQHF